MKHCEHNMIYASLERKHSQLSSDDQIIKIGSQKAQRHGMQLEPENEKIKIDMCMVDFRHRILKISETNYALVFGEQRVTPIKSSFRNLPEYKIVYKIYIVS